MSSRNQPHPALCAIVPDFAVRDVRVKPRRLAPHPLQQLLACNAAGVARVIARARDRRAAAGARVHHADRRG